MNNSTPKIKILHVYRTYFPDTQGGIEEAIRQICRNTNGLESKIFTLSSHPAPKIIGYEEAEIHRSRLTFQIASCGISIGAFPRFKRLANWANVIHYHFPWPFADLLRIFGQAKAPSVMTYHSDIIRQRRLGQLYAPLMRQTLKATDTIVATSPTYARTSPLLSAPAHRDRVRVIPLGLDEHSYPQQGDNRILQRLGVDNNQPFFLFMGMLRYYKGLHTLVQAAALVGAQIVIAGTGPERIALEAQMRQLALQNVVFAGQISDAEKVTLMQRCRALVLPSHLRSEAFGMVLVEASMFGKPMVSCEIGTGTSFVNLHGETGFVVPPESPQALAQAMNALLTNEALAEKFGHAARQRYEQLFSGPALGEAYTQLYHDVLRNQT